MKLFLASVLLFTLACVTVSAMDVNLEVSTMAEDAFSPVTQSPAKLDCQSKKSRSETNKPAEEEEHEAADEAAGAEDQADEQTEAPTRSFWSNPLLRKRRAKANQASKFAKLMNLVKTSKLQDCAGRVVCDLNCDPVGHGPDGKRVLNNLQKLQTSGQIKEEEMQFYIKAGLAGRKLKKESSCAKCTEHYPKCPAQVSDLVAVASLIKLTS